MGIRRANKFSAQRENVNNQIYFGNDAFSDLIKFLLAAYRGAISTIKMATFSLELSLQTMCFFFLFLLLNGNIFTIIIALHRFLCIRLCFVGINVVELTTSFIINFAWLFGLIGHLCVGGHRSQ